MKTETEYLTTGFSEIDQVLKGAGVPCGTVIALPTSPQAPGRAMLHNIIGTRNTLFVTTRDSPELVRRIRSQKAEMDFEAGGPGPGQLSVIDVDLTGDPITDVRTQLGTEVETLRDGDGDTPPIIVVSTVDPLESTAPEYQEFLRAVDMLTKRLGSIAVLHCLATDEGPQPSGRQYTLSTAELGLRLAHLSNPVESLEDDVVVISKVDYPVQKYSGEGRGPFDITRKHPLRMTLNPRREVQAEK